MWCAHRQHLLGQMDKLLTLKKNLNGEFRNLYGPTLDKLKVAQQNLTYRRWDLAGEDFLCLTFLHYEMLLQKRFILYYFILFYFWL